MRYVIALGLLLSLMSVQAGVYKCKDAAGEMQYQDRPCSGAQKAAAFNSSAGNITGIDSAAARSEGAGYLQSREQVRAERRAFEPDQDFQAISGYKRERDRLDSEIARSRDGGIQRSGEFRPRGETNHQRLLRDRRNLEAREIARKNGTTFVPEQAPAVPPLPSAPSRATNPTVKFDQHGTPYTDFGNGAPLVNQQTGRFCQHVGGPNIRCE